MAWIGVPGQALAQEECDYLPGTVGVDGSPTIIRFTRPILACDNGRITVSSLSALGYQSLRRYEFFGNTRLENADIRLQSNNAQYDAATKRISAQGSVVLIKKADGDTIRGDALEYTPAGNGVEEQLVVTGNRPHAVVRPRSGGGATPPGRAAGTPSPSQTPYTIDADRITIEGGDFTGEGRVEIRREDLEAFGDSVLYRGDDGQMALHRRARLRTEGSELTGSNILVTMEEGDPREVVVRGDGALTNEDVRLTGAFIRLAMQDGDLREAVARGDALMTMDDVELSAPALQVELSDGQLQRLWAGRETSEPGAAPPPGATATGAPAAAQPLLTTGDFHVNGDSLYIRAPNSRLDTLRAMGRARIVSLDPDSVVADSLSRAALPAVARQDVISGDTVVAIFQRVDSSAAAAPAPPRPAAVPVADSATGGEQKLESLRAWGVPRPDGSRGASALYRMEPADSAAASRGERAISYLSADTIDIDFENGEVKSMRGAGNVEGLQLEPGQTPRPTNTTTPAPPAGQPAPGAAPAGTPPPTSRPPQRNPEPHP